MTTGVCAQVPFFYETAIDVPVPTVPSCCAEALYICETKTPGDILVELAHADGIDLPPFATA